MMSESRCLRRCNRSRMLPDPEYRGQPGGRIVHRFAQDCKAARLVQGLRQEMCHAQWCSDAILIKQRAPLAPASGATGEMRLTTSTISIAMTVLPFYTEMIPSSGVEPD